MYKFEDFIYIRRNYFLTNLLLKNKDEESFEERLGKCYQLQKVFRRGLELLPERDRKLFLEYINHPNVGSPFFIPMFEGEKCQNHARMIVNRAIYIMDDFLNKNGFEIHIPWIHLTHVVHGVPTDEDEEDSNIADDVIILDSPEESQKVKTASTGSSTTKARDINKLKMTKPLVSELSEKELCQRVRQLCAENDLPRELEFYILSAVVEYINEGTIMPILLEGDPGIGKTFFGKVFADILGLEYYKISAPGAATGRGLIGDSPSYKESRYGEIVNAMLTANATNPVILIDEIDKCVPGSNHSISDELLSCLDRTRVIRDQNLEIEISTANIPFILTANELKNVPLWLKDRCVIVEFPKPDVDRITSIVTKQFVILKDNDLYRGRININEDDLNKIISSMRSKGIVSLRQYVSLIENAAKAAYFEMLEKDSAKAVIDERILNQALARSGGPAKERKIGFV